ncbi:hypothetical protein F511_42610 [Dorcoceras hygrometricum]|uniref:Uncharacterized protein n=1 Tax=Dorcoceras hygrometricum TaxID=472368 RepID=A0A2Z7B9E5_9LAMI|nr:hypothetical protein F511_42610 [Dorcoceras hygrometricum]
MDFVFIQNALQVNLESVLSLPNGVMLKVFKALESTRLRVFFGCSTAIYEKDLQEFFANAKVERDAVVSTVGGKRMFISEKIFTVVFRLPTEGLVVISESPERMVTHMQIEFSDSGVPVERSCKKKAMKIEYRLLNDIIAKALTAKVGSFDVVTQERFDMMVAIMDGVELNWRNILFGILKVKVNTSTKQASGFTVQISLLIEGVQEIQLGKSKALPSLKIFNGSKGSSSSGQSLEGAHFKGEAVVVVPIAKFKRTTVGREAPAVKAFSIVSAMVEPVLIQMVRPSSSRERKTTAAMRS